MADKEKNPPKHEDDDNEQTRPGIPRPGQQPDQQQIPNAPLQPDSRHPPSHSTSHIDAPRTGNPDLDPATLSQHRRIDLRDPNPLVPQGMLFDPRQLLDHQRGQPDPRHGLPPGARFDPFGPPDPSQVGPGRGPIPDSRYGVPDPDHLPPPGMPQPGPLGKSLKGPWPPGPFGPSGPSGPPF